GRHPDRLVHTDGSRRRCRHLDHRGHHPHPEPQASGDAAVRLLRCRPDLLPAADHDRRRECLWVDAGLSAWRDRHCRLDLIMLLLVLLFTVIGDFIEPVPTIIIFMPLVSALTQAGDINSVHMGVVLIATLAFGLITPPYGLVLLMASKFVGVRFSQALRAALPIYVVFLATIVFTIYFPSIVLWLPKQVIPESVGCFKSPSGTGYICPK